MHLLFSAIALGFLGSFHCVGMCGPIALALPLNQHTFISRFGGMLLYNAGRMVTYTLFGTLFGLIGQTFVIAGYQQALSIILGIIILLMITLPQSIISSFRITAPIYSLTGKIKQQLGKLFKNKSYSGLFFIGTLNGLLPCGLVYMGIAGAIASGSCLSGGLFMAMFGLGTFPAMLLLSSLGNTISVNFRSKIRRVVPVFVAGMAVLLILRGMNLGIPYISPLMSAARPVCEKCCH